MTVIARRNYYRGYRGRRTKGKIALAVLLLLVILAAVAVILLQRNVVYDETGAPIESAPHPLMVFYTRLPVSAAEGDILRAGDENEGGTV